MIDLRKSKSQKEIAKWAIDAMEDYRSSKSRTGKNRSHDRRNNKIFIRCTSTRNKETLRLSY